MRDSFPHWNEHEGFYTSTTCVQRSDDSRILQFALRIAFRCVLHRHGNLDIHRWKFSFRFLDVIQILDIWMYFSFTRGVIVRPSREALQLPCSVHKLRFVIVLMIHLQVHLQIPCYDFLLFQMVGFTYFSALLLAQSRRFTRPFVTTSDGRCVQTAGT